nr:uncharacterized protein LOC129385595 isoform X2 [Dermacentor andersoni]
MQTLRVATAILFVLKHISASSTNETPKANEYDIKKFLNTNEIIWTLNTTASIRRPCQLDEKYNITDNTTVFYRDYLNRYKLWERKTLFGIFRHWDFKPIARNMYDSMDTKYKGGGFYDTEIIHYQGENDECAVFAILNGNIPLSLSKVAVAVSGV